MNKCHLRGTLALANRFEARIRAGNDTFLLSSPRGQVAQFPEVGTVSAVKSAAKPFRALISAGLFAICVAVSGGNVHAENVFDIQSNLAQAEALVGPSQKAWVQAVYDRSLASAAYFHTEFAVGVATLGVEQLEPSVRLAAERLDVAQVQVDKVALSAYVGGGVGESGVESLLGVSSPTAVVLKRALISAVGERRSDATGELVVAKAAADTEASSASAVLAESVRAMSSAWIALRDATSHENETQSAISAAVGRVAVLRAHLIAVAPMTVEAAVDIPVVVLDAYQQAAMWAQKELGCPLQWWAIAGTGKIESNHARFMGRKTVLGGDVVPPVRGIRLDGSRSKAIPDSDRGVLDGDKAWDRAVGPNQFIPQTWRVYARLYDVDGNNDGKESPDNIYDASRATAAMHCRSGGGSSDAELQNAYFSYNHVRSYVAESLRFAHEYRDAGVVDVSILNASASITPPALPPLPDVPVREDPTVGVVVGPISAGAQTVGPNGKGISGSGMFSTSRG